MLQNTLNVMFSTIGLFRTVECPESQQCQLPNCIFSHQKPSRGKGRDLTQVSGDVDLGDGDSIGLEDRPRKKRRISSPVNDDDAAEAETKAKTRNRELHDKTLKVGVRRTGVDRKTVHVTASGNISPPPLRGVKVTPSDFVKGKHGEHNPTTPTKLHDQASLAKKVVVEPLNPRMLPNPPAPHATRLKLVTMLHEHMNRLNKEVRLSSDPSVSILGLSPQELVTAVLNEEERAARENPSIYPNILGLRVVALKRMKLETWKSERLKQITEKTGLASTPTPTPKSITTGLSSSEEIALLPWFFAKQETLVKHGYIPFAPSEMEVEQARRGVEAAQGWEQCERCNTRFQVFPGRRAEDGALTTGGTCLYHHAKPRRPTGERADKSHRDLFYACCNETVGASLGCTSSDSHVFKISEAKRLALIMPFEETPPNPSLCIGTAVCFDCEMGYTTYGMELIRLTATSWPDGRRLVDVLVHPLGEILDLNSRFSGVWPKDLASAIPYSASSAGEPASSLQLVESLSAARALLFSHLAPTTPLIGHAIENDLNSARIIHPCVIDTTLLYPHPRGLPMRLGLKALVKRHLERDIQMGGDLGHDSAEDAKAAGDLVRSKVGELWKGMKREGWTFENGRPVPPSPGR